MKMTPKDHPIYKMNHTSIRFVSKRPISTKKDEAMKNKREETIDERLLRDQVSHPYLKTILFIESSTIRFISR